MPDEKEDVLRSFVIRTLLVAGLLATPLIALPEKALADNMMSACETEIITICNGVSKGRGRISACLYAQDDKLSGACKAEVAKVTSSPRFQRYFPTDVQSLQGTQHESDLRKSCTSDADRVCSGMKDGNGRTLACVYSRSNSVSKACWAAAETILN